MNSRCLASIALGSLLSVCVFGQGWQCYGGNAQHSGTYTGASQSAGIIKWQTPLDDQRSYYGNEVFAHFAAPMVTPVNNVVYGYRHTTLVNGNPNYDNWSVIGCSGKTGKQLWRFDTDFSAPILYLGNGYYWTTVYPVTLFRLNPTATGRGVAAGAAGGSVLVRGSADFAGGSTKRLVFYTTVADYTKNAAAYAPIKICTPISADNAGNLYFGYEVTASIPSNLASLGTGGIAKVNAATGASTYKSVEAMNVDSTLTRPSVNAAPAITTDGASIYVHLVGTNSWEAQDTVIARLETKHLNPTAHVKVIDPAVANGSPAVIDQSSASPMIGPDGHVFLGVFSNGGGRESHGWMMQYDADLNVNDKNGVPFPVGAFGWDDTASIVPANIVPSYTGAAKYLILTKYNNYDEIDFGNGDAAADGSNKVAILDPTSNSKTTDRFTGIPVMNEVITVLGVTKTADDPNHPNAVCEWCINSAAVDVPRKSAIINSEDGHMYRWDFVTNTLTESIDLTQATGEAYTETGIGPDGTLYVINNCILFALGTNNANAVGVLTGANPSGVLSNLWSVDGANYSINSVNKSNAQTAAMIGNFTVVTTNTNSLNIVAYASSTLTTTGTVLAYNNKTKTYDMIGQSLPFSATQAVLRASVTTNVSDYVGSGGLVKLAVQAVGGTKPFTLSVDYFTCATN
jgi:hypothetical protein